jgi:ribosomal protein L14
MFLYFEDNAGVIVNEKGEMKGEFHLDLFLRILLQKFSSSCSFLKPSNVQSLAPAVMILR